MRPEIERLKDGMDRGKYATFLGVPLTEMSIEELIVVCTWLGTELSQCGPYRTMAEKMFKRTK